MNTKFMRFIKVCKKDRDVLKVYLTNWIRNYYKDVIVEDGFIYARGNEKILLTAHMDTVHNESLKKTVTVKKEKDKANKVTRHIISSPQGIGGDDRCGIYMIIQIVEKTDLRPYILFCEEEEVGGIGSRKFCNTDYINELREMRFLIELDRAHADDLVYYDDDNKEWHKFCEDVTGYCEDWGSFSDISHLSPACEISSVNISCGYYNAHTLNEYVVFEEMENSIKKTIDLINAGKDLEKPFEYEERKHYKYGFGYGYGYNSYDWDEEEDQDGYWRSVSEYYKAKESGSSTKTSLDYYEMEDEKNDTLKVYLFMLDDGTEIEEMGYSLQEAIGNMMIKNCLLCWANVLDYYQI